LIFEKVYMHYYAIIIILDEAEESGMNKNVCVVYVQLIYKLSTL